MRVLLDENFPLPLCKRLRAEGFEVEHIIELGLRAFSEQRFWPVSERKNFSS